MRARILLASLIVGTLAWAGAPPPAFAFNPAGPLCGAARAVTGANPCAAAKHAGAVIGAGKQLLTGHPGAAVGTAAQAVGSSFADIALAAMGTWVLGGAKFALNETAKVLGATTSPQLRSTWFSGTYWRMAGIAAVLTLPFLFAAAVQAVVRADLALLARAALVHLPLAMLAVSIAAPLTMLLLAASDELSSIVSSAAGNQSAHFLADASVAIGTLSAASASPFLAFLIGVFTVAGAVVLWLELLMRETAVYVIVLMLPLAFAGFVWPARRIWAVRTIELLFALILSKFAIVAVLSLGGAALSSSVGQPSVANWLAGLVLVVMAAFMPWALLRFVPLAEVASGAAGSLRHELGALRGPAKPSNIAARAGEDWVSSVTAHMRQQAQDVPTVADGGADGPEPERGAPPGGSGAGGREGASESEAGRGTRPGAPVMVANSAAPGAQPGTDPDGGCEASAGAPAATGHETPGAREPLKDEPAPVAAQPPPEPSTSHEAGRTEERSASWESDMMRAADLGAELVYETGETARVRRRGGPRVEEDLRPPAQDSPV